MCVNRRGGRGSMSIMLSGRKYQSNTSSSSIGSATLVDFGLLNYRRVFSAGRFLQSAAASGTSNPQPGGPVIRTSQLSPGSPQRLKQRKRTPAAEGGTMGEKLPRILPKVATSTSLLGFLHAVNLRHRTDGFTSPPKKGALRIFSPSRK